MRAKDTQFCAAFSAATLLEHPRHYRMHASPFISDICRPSDAPKKMARPRGAFSAIFLIMLLDLHHNP